MTKKSKIFNQTKKLQIFNEAVDVPMDMQSAQQTSERQLNDCNEQQQPARSIDRAMDIPVLAQRQIPVVEKIQKTIEAPQISMPSEQQHRSSNKQPTRQAVQVKEEEKKEREGDNERMRGGWKEGRKEKRFDEGRFRGAAQISETVAGNLTPSVFLKVVPVMYRFRLCCAGAACGFAA